MRLIDADALWEELGILYQHANGNVTWNDAILEIKKAPTIEERKTGKWIRVPMACYGGGTITEYECSECSEHQVIESKWCPDCGARMEV